MRSEGLLIQIRKEPKTLMGIARVDLTPLLHDKQTQGYYNVEDKSGTVIARAKIKINCVFVQESLDDRSEVVPAVVPAPPSPSPAPVYDRPPVTVEVQETSVPTCVEIDRPAPAPVPLRNTTPEAVVGRHTSRTPSSRSPSAAHQEMSPDLRTGSPTVTLSTVFDKALQMKQELQRCSSTTTVESYEARLAQEVQPRAAKHADILATLPPPMYIPHLLGDDTDDSDDSCDIVLENLGKQTHHEAVVPKGDMKKNTAEKAQNVTQIPSPKAVSVERIEALNTLVIKLGRLKLFREQDASTGIFVTCRYLASRCVVYAAGTTTRLPVVGEKLLLNGTDTTEEDKAVHIKLSSYHPTTSHIVLEFTLHHQDGYTTCLGILDLPSVEWLLSGSQLRTYTVHDSLTDTPSLTLTAGVSIHESEGVATAQQPIQENVPQPTEVPKDEMKMRTVEVVHTYIANPSRPQAPEPQQSFAPENSAHFQPVTRTREVRLAITIGHVDDLPLISYGEGEVVPACYIEVAGVYTKIQEGCSPRWDEELVVAVIDGWVTLKLWHVSSSGSHLIGTCSFPAPSTPTPMRSIILEPPLGSALEGALGSITLAARPYSEMSTRTLPHLSLQPPAQVQKVHHSPVLSPAPPSVSLSSLKLELDSLNQHLHNRLESLQ
eukprot:TRINITY_DN27502_c0_g1_i1.p1 TRINITY_DN27502_c0_g1~~TRINITY_DN27502_c0_g1_i1.p1  ORF type:complete len:766 (+),score=88.91 TRINITY_DN27502_c0_g1_i1:323-2299(+)